MATPLVSLLTDFGLADPSVAACKGVIWRIAPEARLLDVSHGVTRYSVAEGATLLWAALPHLPAGIHLAVIDPGVGTERRPIALRTGRGDHLVGPDNGLLMPAAERLGGIVEAHLLENEKYRLAPVSRTFHARDIFAPAAAHLANGVPLDAFGPAIAIDSLIRLDLPEPTCSDGGLEASVVMIDGFGTAQLMSELCDLEAALGPVTSGDGLLVQAADGRPLGGADSIEASWRLTYGEAAEGEPLIYLDSYGRLALAVNLRSASKLFGLAPDRRLRITRR
jgi:S-adenosylmethionine hydrolase